MKPNSGHDDARNLSLNHQCFAIKAGRWANCVWTKLSWSPSSMNSKLIKNILSYFLNVAPSLPDSVARPPKRNNAWGFIFRYLGFLFLTLYFWWTFVACANASTHNFLVTCTTSGTETKTTPSPDAVDTLSRLPSGLTIYRYQNLSVIGPEEWTCVGGVSVNSESISVYPRDTRERIDYGINLVTVASVNQEGEKQNLMWGRTYFPEIVTKQIMLRWLLQSNFVTLPSVSKYESDHLTYKGQSILFFETPKKKKGLGLSLFPVGGDPTSSRTAENPTFGFMEIAVEAPSFPCKIEYFTERLPNQLSPWTKIISSETQILVKSQVATGCQN